MLVAGKYKGSPTRGQPWAKRAKCKRYAYFQCKSHLASFSIHSLCMFCGRDVEGQSPMPSDPWANCEFHIKWKRYAYIQCSWDTRATLSQLGGYKRVVNYMKRWDDLQVHNVCHQQLNTCSVVACHWGQSPLSL